jgi:hypothetical protein
MSTAIASFIVILLAVAAMAIGVLFGRAPIRGSCGGAGCAACSGGCKHGAAADGGDSDAGERKC